MRLLLMLTACALVGLVAWLVLARFIGDRPVTESQIEDTVAKRTRGPVASVLCNEEVLPARKPLPKGSHTWTCDTYLGRSRFDQETGPSYLVIVNGDGIKSIRRVPTH